MDFLWTLLIFGIGLLVLYVLARLLILPIKWIGKLLLSSLIGFLALIALNYIGAALFGFTLAITPFHTLVVGVFGVPGLLLLILFSLI